MVFSKRLAYHILVAVVLIAPAWGCSNAPEPTPPPEAQQAEEEGGTKEPEVQLGAPAESPDGTTDDSTGSTEGNGNSDGG